MTTNPHSARIYNSCYAYKFFHIMFENLWNPGADCIGMCALPWWWPGGFCRKWGCGEVGSVLRSWGYLAAERPHPWWGPVVAGAEVVRRHTIAGKRPQGAGAHVNEETAAAALNQSLKTPPLPAILLLLAYTHTHSQTIPSFLFMAPHPNYHGVLKPCAIQWMPLKI